MIQLSQHFTPNIIVSYFSGLCTYFPNKWQLDDAWVSLPFHSFLYTIGRSLRTLFYFLGLLFLIFLFEVFFLHFLPISLNFTDEVFYFSHFPWEVLQHTLTNPSIFLLIFSYCPHSNSTCKPQSNQFSPCLALSHRSYKVISTIPLLRCFLSYSCLFWWWPFPLTWASCILSIVSFYSDYGLRRFIFNPYWAIKTTQQGKQTSNNNNPFSYQKFSSVSVHKNHITNVLKYADSIFHY